MHPDWLEAFVAVADGGGFAPAAAALNRSQPTVHVQVGKLAEHLGVTLYVRAGRGIELTPEGRRVAAFARESLQRSLSFEEALRGEVMARPAVLTAGEGAFLYLLGPAIRSARGRLTAPLSLWVGAEPEVQRRVLDGRADIAVTTTPPDPSLDAIDLASCRLCVALPRRHRLAKQDELELSDLAEERWVAPAPDRPLRQQLEREARRAGFELDVAVEVQGWPLLLHFVALGVGVAAVNDVCARPAGVVSRPLVGLQGPRYWAVRRADTAARPDVETMWQHIEASAG